uniref:Heat-inducible transcription repressor HrcA n=1 Tax=Candidatus Kentrum sp. TUN TaxID=2126343 RepID=A0A450ZQR3_9GAMM|nr:MAG: heat-inducible transcription repressor HrcA [Candidatus Kentron sp. TUN]VFK56311.1 MAG: heat-inducible transcription repressor HrcA [Candidatus Kentron sp. TUN]VFK62244.1 MAG: heat-inducible transcription repressor HrcA [Candidatus Kentron sp. TUN]
MPGKMYHRNYVIPELSGRAKHILKVLVERYIQEGQPVGSRVLSRDSDLGLSPATVRNVMADLEDMGLVQSPHTSAGRIPTVRGYRFFVDTLLTIHPLDLVDVARLREQLDLDLDQENESLMETTSALLSNLTHLVGMVTVPRQEKATLRQVEFLPLSHQRVLVILVINKREVQNRIIRTERQYTSSELQQAANYINSMCHGNDLWAVRAKLLGDLRKTQEHMNRIMMVTVEIAEKGLVAEQTEDDVVVAGQTHLMEYGDLADMEKLRNLFDAFGQKRDILHLLDESLKANGLQIFIGNESGYDVLDDCSVVSAPYEVNGQRIGVLGIIGPTRMPYERIIPLVDITAKLLGAALNQRQ